VGEVFRASVAQVEAAVAACKRAGVSQAALARALGKRPATITEWLNGTAAQPSVTVEALEEAVRTLTGGTPRTAVDPRSYAAGLLAGFEEDAERMLARVREARAALGLSGATLPDAAQRETESLGDLDAVQSAAEGPRRKRRRG